MRKAFIALVLLAGCASQPGTVYEQAYDQCQASEPLSKYKPCMPNAGIYTGYYALVKGLDSTTCNSNAHYLRSLAIKDCMTGKGFSYPQKGN